MHLQSLSGCGIEQAVRRQQVHENSKQDNCERTKDTKITLQNY